MPATILDPWDTSVNKMGKSPCRYGSHILNIFDGGWLQLHHPQITGHPVIWWLKFAYAMTNGRNTEGCGTGGLLKDHSWELSHWGWVLGSCFSFPPTQLPLLSVVVHMVQLEGWTLVVPDQILWFQAWLTAPSPYPPSRWLWESHFQLLWASVSSTVKWSHVMMTLYSGHEY